MYMSVADTVPINPQMFFIYCIGGISISFNSSNITPRTTGIIVKAERTLEKQLNILYHAIPQSPAK